MLKVQIVMVCKILIKLFINWNNILVSRPANWTFFTSFSKADCARNTKYSMPTGIDDRVLSIRQTDTAKVTVFTIPMW